MAVNTSATRSGVDLTRIGPRLLAGAVGGIVFGMMMAMMGM